MGTFADLQEATLRERAGEERRYGDLLYFYGAQPALDKLDALATDLDPKNETDLLVYELFQGTGPRALVPLLKAEAEPWVRYALIKALLRDDAREEAMAVWKKSLQWQNPDLLLTNTLIPWLIARGRFDDANAILPVARKLAPDQPELEAWQARVGARQAEGRPLHLDPLPNQDPVAFFLSTRDAAPYLEQTLGGIAAQNHPVAEVILVNDGAMNNLPALQGQYPFRIIDGGGDMPGDVTAAWFAMVPPTAAPAVDYVQQFLLALENAPGNIGRALGRVEDFYQDSPGDRWRMTRMTPAMPESRMSGPDVPESGAAFRPREARARGVTLYLPEAVACGLRQDTLDSAMKAFWQAGLPERQEAGHFKDAAALVRSFDSHLERAIAFINDDVEEGRTSLVFADFLTLFHAVALDAQLAVAQGLVDEGTAAWIQQQVIQSIGALDKEYKRNLTQKVRDALRERLLKTTAPPEVSSEVSQALSAFIQDLNTLYNGVPQDLYLALYG